MGREGRVPANHRLKSLDCVLVVTKLICKLVCRDALNERLRQLTKVGKYVAPVHRRPLVEDPHFQNLSTFYPHRRVHV